MILFSILNNNKKKKRARGPRGCDVARRATWQHHADPAQRLRGAIYIIIFIYLIYIKCSLSSPIWGGSYS